MRSHTPLALAKMLCNLTSSTTCRGLAWCLFTGASLVEAPQHLLPFKSASHSWTPMVYLTNANDSRMPFDLEAGAPCRRSSQRMPYNAGSLQGNSKPTRSSSWQSSFMLFARFVKVLGAFPRKTSPSIINWALTESQPAKHCTNSISPDQDNAMTNQCLRARCKCASRFSCQLMSSVLLTQVLNNGTTETEELGKHGFLNVSTWSTSVHAVSSTGMGRLKTFSSFGPNASSPKMHFQNPSFHMGSADSDFKESQAAPTACSKFTWLTGWLSVMPCNAPTCKPSPTVESATEGQQSSTSEASENQNHAFLNPQNLRHQFLKPSKSPLQFCHHANKQEGTLPPHP